MAIAMSRGRRPPPAAPSRYRGFSADAMARIGAHFGAAIARGDLTVEWSEGAGGEVVSLMRPSGLAWLTLWEQDGRYHAVDGDGLVLAYGRELAEVLGWLPPEPPGCDRSPTASEPEDPVASVPLTGWPS